MRYLETSIYKYIQKKQITIAKSYINNVMVTHPDYPALTSATDALEVLGIPYNALQVAKDNVEALHYPLLAHSNNNGGELVIINNQKELLQEPFFTNWTGVVIVISANTFVNNKENILAYKKEKQQKQQNIIIGLFFFTVLLFPFLYHFTTYGIMPLIQCLLSILGIGIGILIYQQENGIDNSINDTLCKKSEDCNVITHSKAATLFWGIKWSDIGLIYFSSTTLLLSSMAYIKQLINLFPFLSLLSLASILFCIYSLYYQKFIAKKWCTLCLYILAVLGLQAIVNMWYNNGLPQLNTIFFKWIIVTAITFALLTIIWFIVIKKLLILQRKQKIVINNLQRFKHNTPLFINTLTAQAAINIPIQANDLQLANPNAPIQITIACNPYCGPCVDAHFKLEELLQYTKEHIGLTIHFMANHTPNDSKRSKAINAIYTAMHTNNAIGNAHKIEEILHQWFTINDTEKFVDFYKINKEYSISGLQKSDTSTWDMQIEYTPTLLINGYKLPSQYTITDVIQMILPLINDDYAINKLTKKT